MWAGYAALAIAVIVAVGVTTFLFLDDGDGKRDVAAGDSDSVPITPLSGAARPTRIPNTGMLESRRPELQSPAPDFALVDARDGKTVRRLSDFRGKPIVLNWYASWCPPCREEIPDFARAQEALGDKVVFLGIDPQESQRAAVLTLDRGGAKYDAFLDSSGEVSEHYRVQVMPTTYFIDADGYVRLVRAGRVSVSTLVEGLREIGVEYTPAEKE